MVWDFPLTITMLKHWLGKNNARGSYPAGGLDLLLKTNRRMSTMTTMPTATSRGVQAVGAAAGPLMVMVRVEKCV
jgi:hypothetical protein